MEVAVRVAATDTIAVVPAVARISLLGKGIVMSVLGISTYLISEGLGMGGILGCGLACSLFSLSSEFIPFTPGGGLRLLGGTTSGLYEGKTARGTSSTGRGKTGGSGSLT
jgi:hypothetical protein